MFFALSELCKYDLDLEYLLKNININAFDNMFMIA
jgi:hypothetical protein